MQNEKDMNELEATRKQKESQTNAISTLEKSLKNLEDQVIIESLNFNFLISYFIRPF